MTFQPGLPGLLGAALLLAAGAAGAETLASTIAGGVGIAFREPSDAPPYDALQLEYDPGTVLHLDVSSHYDYGLLIRAGYAYTLYDELSGAGGLAIEEDIEQHDARAGAFYSPWRRQGLRYRVGGGYVYWREDVDAPEDERQQDGGFVEAGFSFDAGSRVTFDVAGAALKVEGKDDYDADGAELRLGAAIHTGGPDITLGARYLKLDRENSFDENVLELRVGLGGAWGYAENRWFK